MAASVLSAAHFQNEEAAFVYVEAHLWPNGPVCPHCGETSRIGRLNGKTTRPGLRKCYACKKPFTVRMGTIFESSHLALHLWLQIIHLMCASKKGISTRQIQRMLNCSMKTAWFLGHRIRAAMAPGSSDPIGGLGKTVEADETVLTRSPKSRRHESVDHSKYEWARGDVHTNTLEGLFSIFKRGLIGIYQHVDKKHLARYLAEFDFRQNYRMKLGYNDVERAEIALEGVKGKRLTYQTTC
jgi:transposase-like protein